MKRHIKYLKHLNACYSAVKYYDQFETTNEAWEKSERGDWMLWLLGKQAGPIGSPSRLKVAFVAAQCARLALPYTKDSRVLRCIETTEAYCRGTITLNDLVRDRTAADAADAAADAYAYDAAYAAAAAAAAADIYAVAAADAAADAAYAYAVAAADAAYAAAAYAADAYAARMITLKSSADIIRKYYPTIQLGKYK